MSIEITNLTEFKLAEGSLASLSKHCINELDLHADSELAIKLVDEAEMSSLHLQWLNEPGPTDVLSFPMDEVKPYQRKSTPEILGDIVLCPSVAEKQAVTAGHSAQEELELLTVHGLLHLLGFDHALPDEEKEMFGLQKKLLANWRAR